jgi:hypothetical protein
MCPSVADINFDVMTRAIEGMIEQFLPDETLGIRAAAKAVVDFVGTGMKGQKARIEELQRELAMYRPENVERISESAGLPWRAQLHAKARLPEEAGPGYPFDTMSIWADKERDGITRRFNIIAMWGIAADDAHLIVNAVNEYPKLVSRVRELTELAYRYRRPGYNGETYQDLYHNVAQANGELLEEVAELKNRTQQLITDVRIALEENEFHPRRGIGGQVVQSALVEVSHVDNVLLNYYEAPDD